MGHIIEQIAVSRGHEIVCTIDKDQEDRYESEAFRSADAVIEFSFPGSAVANIGAALHAGKPVVCGTTGWLDSFTTVRQLCVDLRGRFIHASNFSIGVNIFQAVNRYLARIMSRFPEYRPEIFEAHHIHKLDHPSGTAVTTAENLLKNAPKYTGWTDCGADATQAEADKVAITWERRGEEPGYHRVDWKSPIDSISLAHQANSREGFALGAVMAAEWLVKAEPGCYDISDMLAEITSSPDIFK